MRRRIKSKIRVKEVKKEAKTYVLHVLTVRRMIIQQIIISLGQMYAVHARNLVMWRAYAKIRMISSVNKLK